MVGFLTLPLARDDCAGRAAPPPAPLVSSTIPAAHCCCRPPVELSLGKETKALCNQAMDDVDAGRCVSVMVDRTVLNLAADTEAARDEWLAALHTVMIHGNKKLTTLNGQ